MNDISCITQSFKETQALAQEFAKQLKSGEVLCLYGNLGSGKTTFIQGLAKGLGIVKKIISPTFIIIRQYDIPFESLQQLVHQNDIRHFFHVDLYRIESGTNISMLGLFDVIHQNNTLVAIEWPERIRELLPEKRTDIYFDYIDENRRKIQIKMKGER